MKGQAWSEIEVIATVNTYLDMLKMELANQKYVKREYNRNLANKLDGRSLGAIEMKHMNISAVLIKLGCLFIKGYKPYSNYQEMLAEEVIKQINLNDTIHTLSLEACEKTTNKPQIEDFTGVLIDVPFVADSTSVVKDDPPRRSVKLDYLALEQRNRSLGLAGEEFVLDYERWMLRHHGLPKLADKVIHTSANEGDGAGYDISSFDLNGEKRFIEVKTTSYTEVTPFWISRNEVQFSREFREQYQLTRVFNFRESPKIFVLPGEVDQHGSLVAEQYKLYMTR